MELASTCLKWTMFRQGKRAVNPKDNHISFQCADMKLVMKKLKETSIEYVTAVVEEGGIKVNQLFFHNPDSYMIEICNCNNLPVLPLSSCPLKLPKTNKNPRHPHCTASSTIGVWTYNVP
ncbi:hypothetical protein NL676_014221 [Syzygium grande]|nr:hypothetical protein NL676_014221 [Syzygium grande]